MILTSWYLVNRFIVDNSDLIPAVGGIHTEGIVGRAQYLNPVLSATNSADRDISHLVFSGLTKFNPHTGLIEDDIATSEISNDNLTYTFEILPDALWHDGKPVTADDVVYTYRDVLQHESFQQTAIGQSFRDVTITKRDEKLVEFRLSKPYSFFLANVTIGLLPKHVLSILATENISKSEFNTSPIGSGPYVFSSWVQNSDTAEITLRRNETYYGSLPKLETVIFKAFPDEQSLYLAENTLTGFRVSDSEVTKEFFGESRRLEQYPYQLPQYSALFLNTESDILSSKKVRFALLLATDKEEILEKVGEADIVDTPILESKGNLDIEFSLERSMGAFFDTEWNLPSKVKEEINDEADGEGGPTEEKLIADATELTFFLSAIADTWITLRVDGLTKPSFLMKKGDTKEYTANSNLTFSTIGNAAGLSITVNGIALKSLGASGVVLRGLVLDKSTLGPYLLDQQVQEQSEEEIPEEITEEVPVEDIEEEAPLQPELSPDENISDEVIVDEDEPAVVEDEIVEEQPVITDPEPEEIDQIRVNSEGKRLIVRLVTAQEPEIFLKVAEAVKSQWLKAGAKVVIETYTLPDLQQKIQERDYDILLFGQNLGYNLDAFPFWHSSQAETGLNLSNYKSLEADNLLVAIRNTFDERTKDQFLNKLKRVIAEDTPAVFLYNPTHYYALDSYVKNVQLDALSSHSDRLTDLMYWYMREDYRLKEGFSFSLLFSWMFGL
ncbi:MAG: DUF4115 domain-containing protein [Candidatus Gracilibacteria bacterium]|nr:DUF4115 domain-containing protein [Candidatus Gracilibacteria bacterium]